MRPAKVSSGAAVLMASALMLPAQAAVVPQLAFADEPLAVGTNEETGAPIYEDPVTGEDLPLLATVSGDYGAGHLSLDLHCTVYVADPQLTAGVGSSGLRVSGSSLQACTGTYGYQKVESRVQIKRVLRFRPDQWSTKGTVGSDGSYSAYTQATGYFDCATGNKQTWRTVGTGTARSGTYGASARSDEKQLTCGA